MPSKRALITGASSGVGLSFAHQLARAGYDLVLVARRVARLETLAEQLRAEHGVAVEVLPADLATAHDVATVAGRLGAEPAIDLFVNNAGYATLGKVSDLDGDALERMLQVNVVALSRLSTASMRHMVGVGKGSIINVGSGTLFMQGPGNAAYGSSKAYVAYFTRTMQAEASGSGVQVQLLIPGLVATEFHAVAGGDAAKFPRQMVMQPDDLVTASLRALEMGEAICIPSLPDIHDWEAYVAAEQHVARNVSRNTIAPRYERS
jgi:short-subunit dehydrogenase